MSLSSKGDSPDVALETCIRNYSGLVICSAGNDGKNTEEYDVYPANYKLPNLITVGALDSENNKCDFSNYGKTSVDLFAPGIEVLTTAVNNNWGLFLGTSAAAPFVTGVASLILSKYPNVSAPWIKSQILDNVEVVDSLSEYCSTSGCLNAYNVLRNPHTHLYEYSSAGKGMHKGICSCGTTTESSRHVGSFENQGNSIGHSGYCTVCQCAISEGHTWRQGVGGKRFYIYCQLCPAMSKDVPIEFDSIILPINTLNDGDTIVLKDVVFVYCNKQMYMLVDSNSTLSNPMTWSDVSRIYGISSLDILNFVNNCENR